MIQIFLMLMKLGSFINVIQINQFKSESCQEGKRSKDRVTVMIGLNMNRSEKLHLLLIGKSKSPRCFRNVNLQNFHLKYEYNKKAWMTSSKYEACLLNLDKKFTKENRKILMFVDNCPAHPKFLSKKLESIKVIFFVY